MADDGHAPAPQVHRHPRDDGEGEDHGEQRGAAAQEPHERVAEREPRHEVHAQEVEVTAEIRLGRVHRHAAGAEEDDQDGVCRGEPRVGTQGEPEAGAVPGIPGDGQPGEDEADVAPGVGPLADPARAVRLAEAVPATGVRAQPAPSRGGQDEGQ
jgi:hypothetical protein